MVANKKQAEVLVLDINSRSDALGDAVLYDGPAFNPLSNLAERYLRNYPWADLLRKVVQDP
jgi:hypothetical protein